MNVTLLIPFEFFVVIKFGLSNTYENREREVQGLIETCKKFEGVKPLIVTFNQKDKISYGGMVIEAIPAVDFFTGK